MFLERGDDPAEARRLCAGCPVREPCAEAGIDEPPGTGVGSVHVTGGRHDAAQLDTSLYPAEGCFFVSGNRHGRVMERVLREALREDQDELTLAEARELAEEEACNHFGMTSTSSDGPPRRGRSRRTTRWSRISPS